MKIDQTVENYLHLKDLIENKNGIWSVYEIGIWSQRSILNFWESAFRLANWDDNEQNYQHF